MALSTRDVIELVTGERVPVMTGTTKHLSANLPFLLENGIINPRTGRKVAGLPVGLAGEDHRGGMFHHDAFTFHEAFPKINLNTIVAGAIGSHKSSGVKVEIYLGCMIGYNHLVTDPKGEYDKLAKAIPDSRVLRFGKDAKLSVNILDPVIDQDTQLAGIKTMAANGISERGKTVDELNIEESSLLTACTERARALASSEDRVPLLADVVTLLFHPDQFVLEYVELGEDAAKKQARRVALSLKRYTAGDLRGVSDRPTTPGLFDQETPLMVLNVEAYRTNPTLAAAVVMLINFFTQSSWARKDPKRRIHKIYHDESWDLVSSPGFVESVRRSFKLGRTWGVANTLVVHQLNDLLHSVAGEAMMELIADASTKVIYQQDKTELAASAGQFHVTAAEQGQIPRLNPGQSIYKFGEGPGILVDHVITGWKEFESIVKTEGEDEESDTMANQTPEPRR